MVNKLTHRFRVADGPLLILAVLATVLGMFMIYNAGFARSLRNDGIIPREFIVQSILAVVSFFMAAFISRIDIEFWRKRAWPIILGVFALLLLVYIPGVGKTLNGATRWIDFRVFMLQPSELAKLATIVFLAAMFAVRRPWVEPKKKLKTFASKLDFYLPRKFARAIPLIVVGIVAVKVEVEPDLGTAAVILAIMFGMFILGGVSKKSLLTLAACGILGAGVLIAKEPYRLERIVGQGNMWSQEAKNDIGFQPTRSKTAMAAGGVVGVGAGAGAVKHIMPAATTDYIMATIAEEFGLLGSLCVIALIGFLTWRLVVLCQLLMAKAAKAEAALDERLAVRCKFAAYVLGGFACWIGIQSSVNIMMANGTLPPIGIPLPFFSSGGSALIALWMAVGMCQSAAAVLNPQEEAARESSPNRRRNRRTRLSGA